MGAQGQPIRVVQISDCHLFASQEGKLLGMNTQFSLEQVLSLVRQEQTAMDMILMTGDLAQDASEQAYQRLKSAIDDFETPAYWIEGNHDKTAPLYEIFKEQPDSVGPCIVEHGNWTIIMLDSTIPEDVPGEFFPEDLHFLEDALMQAQGEHIMVCMHHHPVPMGCKWLDTQVIASSERFFDIIDTSPKVRALVWGHVHQEFEGERNGVKMFAVPSTCIQFKPQSDDFAVDDVSPGYRWFDLYTNGQIESAVSRVQGVEFFVDKTMTGY